MPDDPLTDGNDEPNFFGQRYKRAWGNKAALGGFIIALVGFILAVSSFGYLIYLALWAYFTGGR